MLKPSAFTPAAIKAENANEAKRRSTVSISATRSPPPAASHIQIGIYFPFAYLKAYPFEANEARYLSEYLFLRRGLAIFDKATQRFIAAELLAHSVE
jgi:hypothetical protein